LRPQFTRSILLACCTLLIMSSVACALTDLLGGEAEPVAFVTPTSYPTFTPTQPVQATLPPPTDTPPAPTDTPAPPPTDTPVPPPPEPAPTDTAVPEPTAAPPPPPTEAPPPPPEEPPPPAEPEAGPHGVIGKITLRDGRDTYAAGEQVFVKIELINKSAGTVPFGVLGLTSSNGDFHTTYTDHQVDIGSTFQWEDGMAFPAPGSYTMWLSVCFSARSVCEGGSGDWERFEPGIPITIQ
jgi:hypothetical protein